MIFRHSNQKHKTVFMQLAKNYPQIRTIFASKIGVAQNLPSEWKAGRNKSYKTKLQTIADAYNVSIDWLYGKTDIKEKPPVETGDIRKQAEEMIARMDQDQLLEFIAKATEKLRQK